MAMGTTAAFLFLIITTFGAIFIIFTQQRDLALHQVELTQSHERDEQKLHQPRDPEEIRIETPLKLDSPPLALTHATHTKPEYSKIVPPGPYMWIPLGDRGQYQGTHLVITTFCYGQGGFLDLIAARLLLFKRICLPTMLAQTNQNYLWMIYVDDTLASEVLAELKELIGERSNIRLVDRSAGKVGSKVTSPQSMSLEKQMLRARMEYFEPTKQNAMVLTTRLDADDGLHFNAIDEIHTAAGKWFASSKKNPDAKLGFLCWVQGVAWQPSSSAEQGAFVVDEQLDSASKENACLSPGFTMVSKKVSARSVLVEGTPHNVVQNRNNSINNVRRRLGGLVTTFPVGISFDRPPKWPSRDNYGFPIRSRTVASNGMYKVDPVRQFSGSTLLSSKLASGIESTYAINHDVLKSTNDYFISHEMAISKNHLQARCVEPFVSCKYHAKNKLKSIRDLYGSVSV